MPSVDRVVEPVSRECPGEMVKKREGSEEP